MKLDAGIRLLSLVNQLALQDKEVFLVFEGGHDGVMGYFDRLGFFQLLNPSVQTTPAAPAQSGATIHRGRNPGVVEFRQICLQQRVACRPIPGELTASLQTVCKTRPDCEALSTAAFTVLGELIDNIFEHSETTVDGYAALQVYPKVGHVMVAVSDSGHGILETLKPTLTGTDSRLSDADLIVKMLNEGLSRHGKERGCGLQRAAEHALKYKAELTIRLANSYLRLVPSMSGVYDGVAYTLEDLPELAGTHISFKIHLDAPA